MGVFVWAEKGRHLWGENSLPLGGQGSTSFTNF